jgi:VWFA-related protein
MIKRAFAFLALVTAAFAQSPSQEPKPTIQTSGEEVLVDVVVRDAKGHAITNLPQSAFTLTDEGEPRQITSFRLVRGTESVSQAGVTTKLDALRQIRLISLIFDRMDQGERAATRQAALEQSLGPNQTGNQDAFTRQQQMPLITSAQGLEAIMARSMAEMISFDERSEGSYEGRSTIWALLAAVRGQAELPGRKALVYFSEGFAIPQGAEQEFKSVISSANRNNLSFYPIDAHGLTSAIQNARGTEGLSGAANGAASSGSFANAGAGPMVSKTNIALSEDNAINANRANLQDTLAILAEETGGFLTANTNDFKTPRQIDVKLNRADLRVQSRAGYFALPPEMLTGNGLGTYEVPLLRALTHVVPNQALPFESGGMHFHADGRTETCGLLIDMPLSNITLRTNADKSRMVGGVAYVALVKDAKGLVAKKLQGEMPLNLMPDQVISLKQSRFTDMEYFDLTPGYYTIEVAVLDMQSGQTNARRNALFVPRQGEGLAMSSVSLIRKWRPKEPDSPPEDPFVIGDKAVTPTLLPKINKSVSTSLPFYVTVYPNSKSTDKPQMFIEFNSENVRKRVAVSTLDAPDSQGRVQYIANAPIAQFDPGNYAVRFVVKQGSEVAEENFSVLLEP